MQSRINAVAELYDVIAHSSAFGPVSMPTYLEGIAKSIRSSLLGDRSDIVVRVDAEDIDILSDHAVPIGLIVNELATNSVKYAFPGRNGEILLGFRRRDGGVVLTVEDDGIGSGSGGKAGMGSRFVEAFVKQVGGSLATGSGTKGTTVSVRLPASVVA